MLILSLHSNIFDKFGFTDSLSTEFQFLLDSDNMFIKFMDVFIVPDMKGIVILEMTSSPLPPNNGWREHRREYRRFHQSVSARPVSITR